MNLPNGDQQEIFAAPRNTAEEKGRDRQALAVMPPEEAQALVTSLPPDGGSWIDVTPDDRWTPFEESEEP